PIRVDAPDTHDRRGGAAPLLSQAPHQLMQTESPPLSRIATMVLFALSCVGLLLFLWLSFGGTMPFNAQGYRVEVAFPNAFDLAAQSDVRIAGVSVGKVVSKQLDAKDNRTLVTIQIDNQYAPIRRNTL